MMPELGDAALDGEGSDLEGTILGGTAGNFDGTAGNFWGTAGNVAGGADGGGEEIWERAERERGAGRKLATGQHLHCFSWDFSLLVVPLNPMLRYLKKMSGC